MRIANSAWLTLHKRKHELNHSFTVVFFEKVLKTFSYDPLTLKGKQVCITGKVVFFKEKPQIVLYDEKDLKVED